MHLTFSNSIGTILFFGEKLSSTHLQGGIGSYEGGIVMKRKDHIENFRFAGIMMMFFTTILFILISYSAYEHNGIVFINLHPVERNFEAFIIFPLVLFFSLFTLSIELYRLTEKQGLRKVIMITILIMFILLIFLFSRTIIFWGG